MTTQTENKIRIRKAADHILKGHSAQATVAVVTETEGGSKATVQRCISKLSSHRDDEQLEGVVSMFKEHGLC